MKYRFYESVPQRRQGMNLYKIVERRRSADPKALELEARLYLEADCQETAVRAIARDLGAGRYIPVLLKKNGKKIYS